MKRVTEVRRRRDRVRQQHPRVKAKYIQSLVIRTPKEGAKT